VCSMCCEKLVIAQKYSAELRYLSAPSAKTLASAEHYKGMFGAPLPEMWEARGDSDGTCHGATLTLNEGAMPQLRSSAVGMVRAGRRGKGRGCGMRGPQTGTCQRPRTGERRA